MDPLSDQDRLSKLYEKCLDGDYAICDKCDGTGTHPDSPNMIFDTICDKCWGEGILDWIEQIMGKESPFTESGSSSTSSMSSSYNNTTPSKKQAKKYINTTRRRNHEHNNSIRDRTVQRFYQVSDKLKRCMQRRGH